MSAPAPIRVSVVIPTLGRPQSLDRAIRSVLAQSSVEGFELVVVDNDPAASARSVLDAFGPGASVAVRYVAAPQPGVSNARNAGVATARGELIAFLDDDQSAPPGWLERLLGTQRELDADVVFGPVRAALPAGVRRHRAFLERFFGRTGPAADGLIPGYHGCGNCLISRAALPHPTAPFCASRNRSGGEDDLLFQAMQARVARFAWAADAWVTEHVPDSRARLAYVLRRAFTYGQGPASKCAAAGPARWPMIPVWMAVGLGQALAYGALALVSAATRADYAAMLDRAAQGLGKMLWFPPFKVAFYGRAPAPSSRQSA